MYLCHVNYCLLSLAALLVMSIPLLLPCTQVVNPITSIFQVSTLTFMVNGEQARVCGQEDSTFMLKVSPNKAGTFVQSLKDYFFLDPMDSNGEAKLEGAVDEGSKAVRVTNLPPSLIFGIKRTQVIDNLPCSVPLVSSPCFTAVPWLKAQPQLWPCITSLLHHAKQVL